MAQHTTDRQLVTLVLVILGVLILFPMVFMGVGMGGMRPMMGGMWGTDQIPRWMFAFGAVMQLLFLVAIVGAGYLIYRAVVGSPQRTDPALEELRVAYARGDLSDEEFEQRREALERDRNT